jgi:hypothetical protein
MRSWQDEIAPTLTVADAAELIRAAAGRVPGLHLDRVAEVGGRYSAVFEARPNPSYSKWLATPWHAELNELLSSVLDTLEHTQGDMDMNVFSSAMFEYLCAEMLPADGRTVSLTIQAAVEETVTGPRGESQKVVVSFRERPKKLILNKTNARALAKVLGPETDAWPGASVVLGVEPVKVGKQTVPSIRVKSATAARPTAAQQQAAGRPRPAFADAGTIPPNARSTGRPPLPSDGNDGDGRPALDAWENAIVAGSDARRSQDGQE